MSPRYRNFLDQPILSLSHGDDITGRDAVQGGTLIVGDSGGGKSSTSLRQIICGLMQAGAGGVLHTVKPEDTANYIAYARACGREGDVIVFNEESGLQFDPLAYEWDRKTGRGAGMIEACIDYFSTLLSIGKPSGGGGENRFWELAAESVMRTAIQLIKLARQPLSIINITRAITSFPTRPDEQEEEYWRNNSYTASLIEAIREQRDTLSESQWEDLETATDSAFAYWANLDPRPRSSIQATFTGLADKFMYHPMRHIFASGKYSFTPEQTTHERKIIIIDFPVNEYGRETAALIQIMVKLTFQRAWLRHKYTAECCHGAFLVQDEFQLLTSKFESFFAQTCRSSGIAMICATQSILGLAEQLGESQPGSKTKAFLNNLGLKIAHRTTCFDTATYFADTIGKEWRYIDNFSAGSGHEPGQGHTSVGGSRQLVHIVDPLEFTQLERPDSHNPRATAIVYRGGEIFNVTKTDRNPQGRNFLRVSFSRE
jgi:type IV secretory pathway TraG/TraD family ATPase VirD4